MTATTPTAGSALTREAACACPEYAGVSRRGVLAGGALLAGAATTTTILGGAVLQTAAAATTPARGTLVVLSLRGAADGLSMVVPHGDQKYYAARKQIAVPRASLWGDNAFYGWHPSLKALQPLWNEGRLAAVHAVGLPAPNRSHFAAMEELEDAAPGSAQRRGWLNRLIGLDSERTSPLQAMNIDEGALPSSLAGPEAAMSAVAVGDVTIAGTRSYAADPRARALHTLWDGREDALGSAARRAFGAVADFSPVQRTSSRPSNGARYPAGDLGSALALTARIIRGNVGTEVVTIDHGSWDMHARLGTPEWGEMQRNCTELGGSLAAFFADLGARGNDVTVVALTEFGRRIAVNANYGLDHGFGSVMLLAGAGVRGGYFGRFPTLGTDVDSDLTVTTDYRHVLSEVVSRRFDVSTASIFPGFNPQHLGVMTP